jgi:RND family efflux transporter MFP subunit
MFLLPCVLACVLMVWSCKNKEAQEPDDKDIPEVAVVPVEKPVVGIALLEQGTFYKEVLGNGKLRALKKAELRFRISELVERVYVRNGDRVAKGALLAETDRFTYQKRLEQARYQVMRMELEMKDFLLSQGYAGKDSAQVPSQAWQVGLVRSGLRDARHSLLLAQHDYESTELRAPFPGVIADVNVKDHNTPSGAFCTLIDDSVFEAEFSVLESELAALRMSQPVQITPFAQGSESFSGTISAINPVVGENGLVKVLARVPNRNGLLFEGMNVRVAIRYPVPNQLIIPKEAMVLRGTRTVVFTLEKGRAQWKDVRVGEENRSQYSVLEGLQPGDTVIVSGNLNLGHDTEVELSIP